MPWKDAGKLHSALTAKGLKVDCAVGVRHIGPTQYAATFIPCDGTYVQIHWRREPTPEERKAAIEVVQSGCSSPICPDAVVDSETKEYPPDTPSPPPQLPSLLGYYWQDVWLGGYPGNSRAARIDLSALHDLIVDRPLTQGIRVKGYRLGVVVFDFSSWSAGGDIPDWPANDFEKLVALKLRRLAVMNTHLLCIADAYARLHKVCFPKLLLRHEDVIAATDFDDPFKGIKGRDLGGPAFLGRRYPPDFAATHHPNEVYDEQMKWWSATMGRAIIVSQDVLKDSLDKLTAILDHSSPHALQLVEILAHSCKACEDHNYNLALVTAWAIIEKTLSECWGRHLDDLKSQNVEVQGQLLPVMNSDRKRNLTGSDYTASIISETLNLLGLLPFELYRRLKRIRDGRNHWLHRLKPVSGQDADKAIQLAQDMLRHTERVDLNVPIHFGLHL